MISLVYHIEMISIGMKFFFNCSPQVVFYRSHYIEFAIECLRGNDIICIDFSLGIKLDRKIIALFPLFYIENKNKKILGFLEDTICPPIFIHSISKKIKKKFQSYWLIN